jgi:hypothetical protein
MGSTSKILLAGHVWLTAAMTLVAGFPHFECRCPNGLLKPFCLGFCSPNTGCCGEPCCRVPGNNSSSTSLAGSSAVPAKEKGCCCCQHKQELPPQPLDHSSGVTRPGCVRSVAPAKPWTSSSDTTTLTKDGTVQTFSLPSASLPMPPSQSSSGRTLCLVHSLGPPTDLVILHQHFVI